mgnify:CR=1 FL=1
MAGLHSQILDEQLFIGLMGATPNNQRQPTKNRREHQPYKVAPYHANRDDSSIMILRVYVHLDDVARF